MPPNRRRGRAGRHSFDFTGSTIAVNDLIITSRIGRFRWSLWCDVPSRERPEVTNDPTAAASSSQWPFFLDDERGGVLDPGNQRRVRPDDGGEQLIVGIAAIDDIKPPGPNGLATTARSEQAAGVRVASAGTPLSTSK